MSRPVALVLGPQRDAVSGVSTHLNQLFASRLADEFPLVHFQVGSEGRRENAVGRLLRILTSPFLLAAAILGRRAVLVHLNTSVNARAFWRDAVYLLVAKTCGARVVYQVHGGVLPQRFYGRNRLFGAILREILNLPDSIVVLGSIQLEAYRRFVPGRQVVALPNGIDCMPYMNLAHAPSDPAAPLRLAYIGRLVRAKGLYETLQGLRLAQAEGARATLVIAGSGPEEPHLRLFTEELGLAADVAFTGPVDGERKARLLAGADVLVLASYSEGLPYAVLEGMAAGTPPIATRVGAIPDVVVEGVHGLLVAPHDANAVCRAIVKLASDRNLLRRMSDAGRERVAARYSLKCLGDGFCRLYADLYAARQAGELTGF